MSELNHRELGLSDDQVLDMYRYMLLARKVDERMWLLNRAGKIPFVISCQGQEAIQVGATFALDREKDWLCPYYRDLGMMLVFGQTARDQMLSAFAKAEDPNSGGRQMPGHYGDHRFRILTGSSPVTTQVLHAVGIAYAGKLENKDHVVLTTCGEGSSNQGDWHEACNFAGVHKLPVIFMVENNKYAISVPLSKQVAGGEVWKRAEGYGFPGIKVDGNNPLEVYKAVKEAAERGRKGEGPTLIEAVSYRLVPHSSDDDDRTYRAREEVEEAKKKDSLVVFKNYLMDQGVLTEEKEKEIQDQIAKEVNDATDYAEKAPYPEPETIHDHVYA
ncbi:MULTISPECIES: thiamine pyrophosphate-dependent dehydrogenase E1 component subunit alpha [Thermoactinomyces]|jgi:2-oxoisovalerate dehydrogenase E1 component alpha subunit|uniref:2-oxoisovalerate dehydrogenase subunit alpha n=2 Tax=Thermoactinomyces TaxID=2023 RepID=A0A8I1DBI0_THEIN|nr:MULTISPECIES: thiamine pyrophosphate-dependent dehydrogenase E1 component subunit alpha [Thermoactinomyces]KFZ39622.1 2-oxoisovalerate dehydrogenase [Thermoactinomyces sp. Gus2-1]KYQ87768.1 2-oxoisovalerate dehydrogenase [Thermoactinomyces sp. AS95]MBA4548525.1 thiamine pyrophosphate-dependent dehydrogenase E1 component subunit alpha [Thermoactinomyces intermedius]MBA4550343.1 thiamine pyrophosphate-dependent dehydrogenase E1 component subunit alpha [Thermoactinomyces vulgaris]MBA4595754.1 